MIRRIVLLFIFFALVALCVFLSQKVFWTFNPAPFVAIGLLFVLMACLVSLKPMGEMFDGLQKLPCLIYSILLFLIITFHYIQQPHASFPFLSWYMYTNVYEVDSIEFFRVEAENVKGERETLLPDYLYPALWGRLGNRVLHSINTLRYETQPEEVKEETNSIGAKLRNFLKKPHFDDEQEREDLKKLLSALGRSYNKKNKDNPAVKINLVLGTIPRSDFPKVNIETKLLLSVEPESDL